MIAPIKNDAHYKVYLNEVVFLSDIPYPSQYVKRRIERLLGRISTYEKFTFKQRKVKNEH